MKEIDAEKAKQLLRKTEPHQSAPKPPWSDDSFIEELFVAIQASEGKLEHNSFYYKDGKYKFWELGKYYIVSGPKGTGNISKERLGL